MLSVEKAVEDIVINNGMYAIPLSSFFCDWSKLAIMFNNTVKRFEQYRPVNKRLVMHVNQQGVSLPDAIIVKSVSFYSQNMIPSQCSPLNSDEWDFDKHSKLLQTIGSSTFLVSYLSGYTMQKQSIVEDTYTTLASESSFDVTLQAFPDVTTMLVKKGSNTFVLTSRDSSRCVFTHEATGSTATLTYGSLKMRFALLDELITEDSIAISYTSLFKAAQELMLGDEVFQTFFGAELLSSIGNIKAIMKFDSLPADFTADGLIEQGKFLREQVEKMKEDRSYFYEFLTT